MKYYELIKKIENLKPRYNSAWNKGVKVYALELLDEMPLEGEVPDNIFKLKDDLLNGARDWHEYSYGGCSCIYDKSICERLANPTERKRTDYGRLEPNSRESWLDVQARALYQAWRLIRNNLD